MPYHRASRPLLRFLLIGALMAQSYLARSQSLGGTADLSGGGYQSGPSTAASESQGSGIEIPIGSAGIGSRYFSLSRPQNNIGSFNSQTHRSNDVLLYKISQIEVLFFAGIDFEYNSNIDISSEPSPDFIISPEFGLHFFWPITRHNTLSAVIGLSYDKYLINTDRDQSIPTVDPGTVLQWNIYAGDFIFSIYDAPVVTQDQTSDPTLSNASNFTQFQNNGGITILWDLNDVDLVVSAGRQDTRSLNSNYEGLDTVSYYANALLTAQIDATLSVGLTWSVFQTEYLDSILNDSLNASLGVQVQKMVTPYLTVNGEIGLQSNTYDESNQPTPSRDIPALDDEPQTNVTVNTGGGDYFGVFWQFGVLNRLNRYWDHGLTAGHQAQSSSSSNYVNLYTLDYFVDWRMNRFTTIHFKTSYNYGINSGEGGERFSFLQADLGADFEIFKNWTFNARLRHTQKISDISGNDYTQNQVIFSFEFRF